MQVVRAVSHSSLLAILAAVCKRHSRGRCAAPPAGDPANSSYARPCPSDPPSPAVGPYVVRLLQLLPRIFHPAVVTACCLDPTDGQSCDLALRDGRLDSSMFYRRMETEELTQLLAAAAPLAGGCQELAYAPRARASVDDSGAILWHVSIEDPEFAPGAPLRVKTRGHVCREPAEAACGTEWRLAAGAVTRLQVSVPACRTRLQEPLQWCTALAQLRTLRSLKVVMAHGPLGRSAGGFTSALRSLPDLTHLCIDSAYTRDPALRPTRDLNRSTYAWLCADTWQLLEGVATLPPLQSLDLDRGFNVTPTADRAHRESAERALSQLSRLSRLTCLRYAGRADASGLAHVWGGVIRQLPALQKLCVVLVRDSLGREMPEGDTAQSGLLHSLFGGTGLTSLQHLQMSMEAGRGVVKRSEDAPVAECHACMRKHNPALLARLTGLYLGAGLFGCEPEGGSVAALLADMQALQSLRLNSDSVGSTLRARSERSSRDLLSLVTVLPGLSGLTRLDVSRCGESGAAVLAMLAALAQPGTAVCEGLRDLDIGCNGVRPQHAVELAGLLRQFRGLERLGIEYLGLCERYGLQGLGVVLRAVAALPRLQVLNAARNCPAEDRAAAWDLTAGLAHVREIRL